MKNPSRPLIGITTRGCLEESPNSVPEPYLRSVIRAGGEPVLLPSVDISEPPSILGILDGVIGTGGGDIDPEIHNGNGTLHPTTYGIDKERDRVESQIFSYAIDKEIPLLLICRSMQLANVISDGDLISHIPEVYGKSVSHRLDLPCGKSHPVEHWVELLETESLLSRIAQEQRLSVVSCHHMAVNNFGKDWRVVAKAPDGVIEAIEHIYHQFCLGVQWHPELSNDPTNQRLFESLVKAASRRKVMQD